MVTNETPAVDRMLRLDFDVDPVLTLRPLRHGPRDPTIRFERGVVWRATRTIDGAATVRIARGRDGWRVTAWGAGSEKAVSAIPRLLGAEDDPTRLQVTGRVRELVTNVHGLRFGRSDAVMESLVPAIIGQKVTGHEAQRAYHGLIARFGVAAPGPGDLRLAPDAETIAALPYFELHPLGLEQRRAVTLIRACERAPELEQAIDLAPDEALTRLRSITGVGVWTAAETARSAFGNPDAVSIGDFHTPNLVAWALAGEPRADDTRMLELLEPYRGQRARLVRVLELSGIKPPKYGPRSPVRAIGSI
jgi:3-methyladenine DNA glycosylase/8-oxoguanine DNA glycosylase